MKTRTNVMNETIRLLVGGTLSSRELVYLNTGDRFSLQAGIQLDDGAITAQPTEKPVGVDRIEARPQFDGSGWPGGVRSSITTLLPIGMA